MALLLAASMLGACGSGSGDGSAESSASAPAPASTCKPKHADIKTVTPGTLTVVAETYMPSSDIKNGVPTGIEGDVVNAIAKMECLKVDATRLDNAGVISTVQTGRADLAFGDWYASKPRNKVVTGSYPIYKDSMGIISKTGIDNFAALKGKRVGDPAGTSWATDVKDYIGSGYKVYQTQAGLNADVVNGRLDAGISTLLQVAYALKQGEIQGIQIKAPVPVAAIPGTQHPGQAALQMTKGNDSLITAINDDIKELHASGKLKEIVASYGADAAILEVDPSFLTS